MAGFVLVSVSMVAIWLTTTLGYQATNEPQPWLSFWAKIFQTNPQKGYISLLYLAPLINPYQSTVATKILRNSEKNNFEMKRKNHCFVTVRYREARACPLCHHKAVHLGGQPVKVGWLTFPKPCNDPGIRSLGFAGSTSKSVQSIAKTSLFPRPLFFSFRLCCFGSTSPNWFRETADQKVRQKTLVENKQIIRLFSWNRFGSARFTSFCHGFKLCIIQGYKDFLQPLVDKGLA